MVQTIIKGIFLIFFLPLLLFINVKNQSLFEGDISVTICQSLHLPIFIRKENMRANVSSTELLYGVSRLPSTLYQQLIKSDMAGG